MSIRGPRLKYFVLVFAVIALAFGIYDLGFSRKGYEKNTGTIVEIKEELDTDGDTDYILIVEHTVDGKKYRGQLDQHGSKKDKVGDPIDLVYDPSDPSAVKSPGIGAGIYSLVVGVMLAVFGIGSIVREKKAQKDLEENYPETHYAPSVSGEERHLYFLTDQGTAKFGHRIEDAEGHILYEAKVTKFTLSAPTGFEFIDHEHGKRTPHLIGHQESTEWNSILIDNHYTFTFDGEFIWDHLKKNGISVESSFMDGKLWPQYRIFRDGKEIALVQSSSMHIHEEDEEKAGKLSKLLPAYGYYRIWTTETNLDLLFVTILAFARSEAVDDEGGTYGLLLGKNRDE